ncbi:DUF998 domain-containing protein [Streptomyces syringium]|uniref:DUF998 domain-containing protein n=1 Tax=Streptomyces syringium TaxID=76729 RepID=UPI0034423A06
MHQAPECARTPRLCGLRRRLWAALLLGTAAVAYNGWLLEVLLPTGLDPRHSYVSELYAADQPFQGLFSGIEVACALLVTTGALLARYTLPGRLAAAGWWAVIAFAACSVADTIVPMRCAPSVDPSCEAVNPWHTTTSALVHFAIFSSMALLSAAAKTGCPSWPLVRRWGPWLLPCAMVCAVATVGPLFGGPGWHGIPQRAHLILVGTWFALLAVALVRPLTHGGSATGTPAVTYIPRPNADNLRQQRHHLSAASTEAPSPLA